MTTPLIGAKAPIKRDSSSPKTSTADDTSFADLNELIDHLPPRTGHLKILRTKAEAEASLSLVQAHIVAISPQDANRALIAIDAALPPASISSLQHLRRVAKAHFLPPSARDVLGDVSIPPSVTSSANRSSSSSSRSSSTDSSKKPRPRLRKRRTNSDSPRKLYIAAAPTAAITIKDLSQALSDFEFKIYTLDVPATAPRNNDEAQAWSVDHWPTVYRAHNPYGPQPVFISRGEGVINLFVGSWISLAEKVAQETSAKGHGERVGAVVVDSNASWSGPVPVAVAGDGRWIECGKDTTSSTSYSGSKKQDKGNPAAHAVMRAIGMVARQRVERGGRTVKDGIESPLGEGLQLYEKPPVIERSKDAPEPNIFHDQPATDLEEFVYKESLLPPGGYLCSGLEMYLTHEPCVMCSMALLHSRFDRVVIARKMPKTGAMVGETARGRTPLRENVNGRTPTSHDPSEDGGLGYGLFWRPELNWKMLVWEWIDDNKTMSSDAKSRRIHA